MMNLHAYVPKQAVPQPFYTVEPPQEFDERGKELGPDAQVWKTYLREADQVDGELVDGWNKSTDVILIFAALFSAISTAFVIESYKNLKQDPADVSAQTLLVISQNIAIIADGSQPSGASPSLESQAEAPHFTAPLSAIVVNALWFLSLSLSVAVSLISMLAKEWCLAFMSGRTGPPGPQARRRQQRWDGLVNWKMKEVLMVLPSLIHLSLLLFAIGLCVFLWDVHFGVAIPVVFVTTIAAGVYIGCTILPFIDSYCPYGTVLSRLYRHFIGLEPQANRVDFKQDEVTVQALQWMVANCETPRSIDVAFQSLAGLNKRTRPYIMTMLEEWNVCTLMKQRLASEAIDSEHKDPSIAAYSQALTIVTERSSWGLTSGSNKETQRLEVLVMGLQSFINFNIAGKRSTLGDYMSYGMTHLGGDFLLKKGITQPSYMSRMDEVNDSEQLCREVIHLLEQHLLGNLNLEPTVYSVLCAVLAFLLPFYLEAKPTVTGTHIATLLRAYFARKSQLENEYNKLFEFSTGQRHPNRGGSRSQRHMWETFHRYSIQARELALVLGTLSASKPLCSGSSEPSPMADYTHFENPIESIWDNLIAMIHGSPGIASSVNRAWACGTAHLLANPNLYNWSSEDYDMALSFYMMWLPGPYQDEYSRGEYRISDVNLSRQYIQDITSCLSPVSNITLPTVQILRFLQLFALASPWDNEVVPTPEIYVFVIKSLCHSESLQVTRACCQLMGTFPFPKATPRFVQLLSIYKVIDELAGLLQSGDLIFQTFAMSQLWLLFDMTLHFEDQSSDVLSDLETMLLPYDGFGNNLAWPGAAEHLSTQLSIALDQQSLELNEALAMEELDEFETQYNGVRFVHDDERIIYFHRVYECILQRCNAPIPEFVSRQLSRVPEYLRGISSSISFEDNAQAPV